MTDEEGRVWYALNARSLSWLAMKLSEDLSRALDQCASLKGFKGARRLQSRAAKCARELAAIGAEIRNESLMAKIARQSCEHSDSLKSPPVRPEKTALEAAALEERDAARIERDAFKSELRDAKRDVLALEIARDERDETLKAVAFELDRLVNKTVPLSLEAVQRVRALISTPGVRS